MTQKNTFSFSALGLSLIHIFRCAQQRHAVPLRRFHHLRIWLEAPADNNSRRLSGNQAFQSPISYTHLYGVVLRSNGTDEANAFRPSVNAGTTGHLYLGVANQKWRAVFAQNGTIQTSDRNAKHDITDLDPEKITAFIMGLKPSSRCV